MEVNIQSTAAALCLVVGTVALVLRPKGLASWSFFAGMLLLGLEQWFHARLTLQSEEAGVRHYLARLLTVKSIVPGVWFGFSLIYARGNRSEFLKRWKWGLLAALLLPSLMNSGRLGPSWDLIQGEAGYGIGFTLIGRLWVVLLILITLGILINLEKTFRSSVGMTRWRIKYLFLGAGLVFGVKLYGLTQILLYSSLHAPLVNVESVSVILGCVLIAVGHSRSSFGNLDIYPSRALLQGSLTVFIAGAYFLVVGLLAQVVGMLGGAGSLPAQAFMVLLGLVGLTALLLSDRFRSWLQRFVSRHFRRPEHDFRKLWTDFTRRTSNVIDAPSLGKSAAEIVSESFNVLGVSVFGVVGDEDQLVLLHSTGASSMGQNHLNIGRGSCEEIQELAGPRDLEKEESNWAHLLRESCNRSFEHGGNRVVVPLSSADRLVGVMVLADRVNGVPYSVEEFELLGCISDQLGSGLLNCTLTTDILQAKELEAFQTFSTFFVHDLKNAANSLNLTLQNLPVHFDDPEFRKDAIRAVGRTVERINKMILNLSSLRRDVQLKKAPCQLGDLLGSVLDDLEPELRGCKLEREIGPMPDLQLDVEAIRSVLINLITNASEALGDGGQVNVVAKADETDVLIKVADNGVGMSEDFVRDQLFRPFRSTKTRGLGVGMFQCKKIVEAHLGGIRVKSIEGKGTEMILRLPIPSGGSLKRKTL